MEVHSLVAFWMKNVFVMDSPEDWWKNWKRTHRQRKGQREREREVQQNTSIFPLGYGRK